MEEIGRLPNQLRPKGDGTHVASHNAGSAGFRAAHGGGANAGNGESPDRCAGRFTRMWGSIDSKQTGADAISLRDFPDHAPISSEYDEYR